MPPSGTFRHIPGGGLLLEAAPVCDLLRAEEDAHLAGEGEEAGRDAESAPAPCFMPE